MLSRSISFDIEKLSLQVFDREIILQKNGVGEPAS